MTTGTIKKVVAERGFGFIAAEDTKEYFFHRNSLDQSLDFDRLVGGERVTFEIEASPKGPRAEQVRAARRHGDGPDSVPAIPIALRRAGRRDRTPGLTPRR